jgi:hypothetical protein
MGHADHVLRRWLDVVEHWGSTEAERGEPFPCDRFIANPRQVLFRAVDVDAPAATVYRWLCQLRVAPYSYDWIDNLGRRSPRQLIDGLDALEIGQRAILIFRVVDFEPGRSITLFSDHTLFGTLAVTYRVTAVTATTSRLVVKLIVVPRPGRVGWVLGRVPPVGDFIMMRKQLLNLKGLAEQSAATARTAPAGS